MIEILTTGALNSVQDLGRPGYLAAGVSHCGAMDRLALQIGNALLGNAESAACIEVAHFPFRLRIHRDTAIAVTGADDAARVDEESMPPNWARSVTAGQTLTIGPPRSGARVYVSFAGGIDVPQVLGSRATDQKGGFGGLAGRGLLRGDRLCLFEGASGTKLDEKGFGAFTGALISLARVGQPQPVELHVLPAAEHEAFTPEALGQFFSAEWLITNEANRMGYRLSGPVLSLKRPLELLSHGIVPGTVQVPPSGQPIIQLADANTCGGYPKIANVIDSDLWRLAQAPTGTRLRFIAIDRDAAVDALRKQAAWIADLRATAALLQKPPLLRGPRSAATSSLEG